LSTVFITLSFLRGVRKLDFQFLVDSLLMGCVFFGLWNSKVDNIVHFFAVGCSIIYWELLKKKANLDWFLVANLIYMGSALLFMQGMRKDV